MIKFQQEREVAPTIAEGVMGKIRFWECSGSRVSDGVHGLDKG